ncbi:hypothetical protein CHS0354_015738, partial [Potamilus streckersoni]
MDTSECIPLASALEIIVSELSLKNVKRKLLIATQQRKLSADVEYSRSSNLKPGIPIV